jgi:hypothetical protein
MEVIMNFKNMIAILALVCGGSILAETNFEAMVYGCSRETLVNHTAKLALPAEAEVLPLPQNEVKALVNKYFTREGLKFAGLATLGTAGTVAVVYAGYKLLNGFSNRNVNKDQKIK